MKLKKLASLALAGALTLGLLPALSSPALAADNVSTYTLQIPSTLTVSAAGWNKTSGLTAAVTSGDTFDSGKKLTVTAASTNSWSLKSGSNSVGYNLATATGTYSSTATPASWEFTAAELNTSGGTNKAMGIIVDDYSSKPAGTYTDTVTFTVKVEDAAVVKTLTVEDVTLDYCDGDTWQQIVDRNPDKIKTASSGGWEVRIVKINGSFESWNLCKGSIGSNNFVYADHVVDPNATYVWWE